MDLCWSPTDPIFALYVRELNGRNQPAKGFKKYCDLISCLLVAEQNNELLMKNHESGSTGPSSLSKANVVTYNQNRGRGHGSNRRRRRGSGRGCGHGQGRGFGQGQEAPTVVHEDNAACIAQLKDGYIKGDRTKNILPKVVSKKKRGSVKEEKDQRLIDIHMKVKKQKQKKRKPKDENKNLEALDKREGTENPGSLSAIAAFDPNMMMLSLATTVDEKSSILSTNATGQIASGDT
uniref:Uncharacterized protein n=1 Tax=Tanacetum cinerariifolium TaxID=118510 RepID=A0A6L2KAP2_TANCI|nr:hypothetical protein [Tanacetum cinerariifolium]